MLGTSFLLGCHQEHLCTYTRLDDQSTLHQLAEQGHRIHDVSATGSLNLSQKNGDSVRLTLAVALNPPDNARLRTWKFGQAVFDLTVIPTGSWLETPKDSSHAASIQSAGITAAQVTRGWALLGGGFFERPKLTTRDEGNRMYVTQDNPGEPSIVCVVDRDTLAVREYRLYDDKGKLRFHLELGDYQDFDGILWPRRIVATSDTGVIDVSLDDVTMNGGLPDSAFVPPRRAERLP